MPVNNRTRLFLPAIALITVIAFLPALTGSFLNWDDERNFVTNPHYRGLGATQLRWMWSTFLLGHYIPVSWMTLGADYVVWGMNPLGYHLTSILIHAANACLVFLLAQKVFALAHRVTDAGADFRMPAAAAALLFAVHPLRAESVAWITERRDVVSGFFFLASALAYTKAVESGERRARSYWTSVALFMFAVLSKATVVTLPAVLFLLNVYPLRRIRLGEQGWRSSGRVVAELVPFAIPAALALIVSVVAVHPPFIEKFGLGGVAPTELARLSDNVSAQNQFGVVAKLAVSAYSFCFYLLKTLVPIGLSPLYEMPRSIEPASGVFLLSYAGVLAIIAGLVLWRRFTGAVIGMAIFFVITLPMLGLVQNGPQISADRYTYHAAPALAMLIAGGVWAVRGARRQRAYTVGMSCIVGILVALTLRQSTYWIDSERLWTRVLAVDPQSSLAHSAMASLRYRANRVDEGLAHSQRALELAPDFAEARNDLGVGLQRKGMTDDAAAQYHRALSLKPRFDDAENNLGVLLMQVGRPDSAITHYRRALAINPENANAEINWGNALVRAGRTAEAISHYERAVWIRPDASDAFHNWGVALAREQRFAEAIEKFQRTLAIDPAHAEAREYLELATRLLRLPAR